MSARHSFPPIAAPDAHTLILGSMPGQASLSAGAYYAHPRNAFWPIMAELFGFDPAGSYAERVQALTGAGIAVWDVLAFCIRPGSLDADIAPESMQVNDFAAFLGEHAAIRRIFFNGSLAESIFRKHCRPHLDIARLTCQRLPSSSPAHAGLRLAEKCDAWRILTRTAQAGR